MKPVNSLLQDDESAGIQSLQTSILCNKTLPNTRSALYTQFKIVKFRLKI